jgi:hypothetical protein
MVKLKIFGLVIFVFIIIALSVETLYADGAIQNVKLVKEGDTTRVDFEQLIYNTDSYVFQIVIEWGIKNRAKPELHNLLVDRCMPVGSYKLSDKVMGGEVEKVSIYFDPRPESCSAK